MSSACGRGFDSPRLHHPVPGVSRWPAGNPDLSENPRTDAVNARVAEPRVAACVGQAHGDARLHCNAQAWRKRTCRRRNKHSAHTSLRSALRKRYVRARTIRVAVPYGRGTTTPVGPLRASTPKLTRSANEVRGFGGHQRISRTGRAR